MKKAGQMMVLDNDEYFTKFFNKTQDQFEIMHLEAMYPFVRKWDLAVDCGAHYGSWTRYMAKRFKQVVSIEANKEIFECLTENTKHLLNVDRKEIAIGDKEDFVTVGPGEQYDNTGCGMVLGKGSTPMLTLDSLKLPTLDLLKIDVEGLEYHTLRGGEFTIRTHKPVILFEDKGHSNRFGVEVGEVGRLLESWGATHRTTLSRRDFIYSW